VGLICSRLSLCQTTVKISSVPPVSCPTGSGPTASSSTRHLCSVDCATAIRRSPCDERQPETGAVSDAREMRLQGNRRSAFRPRPTPSSRSTAGSSRKNARRTTCGSRCSCRRAKDLIERTVESLVGAKKAIIHLYNSTSPAQRRVVFGKSKKEIVEVAVRGAKWIKDGCRSSKARKSYSRFRGKFQHDGS